MIGYSGKTGTAGGHYGRAGYPHLHLSVMASDTGEYRSLEQSVQPQGVRYIDPVALYLLAERGVTDNHAVRTLPDALRTVAIPYKDTGGNIFPPDTRLIWPFICAPR